MPEYLAPGVYIEEVSYRAKSIEGVSTTTTGFIGPARYGPIDLEPDVITSLGEFERVYGDRQQLTFSSGETMDNYLWHAARAFFQEGGRRLYISRVFKPISGEYTPQQIRLNDATKVSNYPDGHARAMIGTGTTALRIRARFPGALKMRVRLTLRLSQNILSSEPVLDALGKVQKDEQGKVITRPKVGSLLDRDIVWISNLASPPSPLTDQPAEGPGDFYIATPIYDKQNKEWTWEFNALESESSPPISPVSSQFQTKVRLQDLNPERDGDTVRVVTLSLAVTTDDGNTQVWDDLPLDLKHQRAGSPDSLFDKFSEDPGSLSQALRLPIVLTAGSDLDDGLEVLETLLAHDPSLDIRNFLDKLNSSDNQRSIVVELEGGNDGQRPDATQYEGDASPDSTRKTGLKSLEGIDDISIIAAPGSTYGYENGYQTDAQTIMGLLISHAENMRYRIAVIDSGNDQAIADVRALRARLDSKYAALYYPWVRILDPVTQREINLPPSGFVAGIYARNDINRAVYKAPANEVVNLAIGFEQFLNKGQQDVLNPEGINCFRFFEGRGFRLWGARTISSDPEWKYVNLRRYFAYLEHSIDKGTQWAVFEPNGEALWANIRRTIEDFLFNEWVSGALLGDKPDKAFFVRCDRSTMTQNDLDNGRLVCQIGVAPLRPAEFVIFRIGQWTADRKA
ncbi:MAG TPA: phage tail sheath subtilisin-like domain-containing protein [Pyrinomonadaceae bacterium]